MEESKVDLYHLVGDYNENYFPVSTGDIVEINGKDYLPIAVHNPDWYITKRKQLWLNLETKQIDWEDTKIQQFLDLYQLFVPANTNLYEGITIPAELSKDDQEHSVNTKEEFDLYYDVAKDRELNKQRRILVEKEE